MKQYSLRREMVGRTFLVYVGDPIPNRHIVQIAGKQAMLCDVIRWSKGDGSSGLDYQAVKTY